MAKFQLQENETLIGSGLVAYKRGYTQGTISGCVSMSA